MIENSKRVFDSRNIIIRKMRPGTTEQPNPQWVQCASKPDCCPVTPNDKRIVNCGNLSPID